MKRYIIDMGTPKEVLFFKPIYEELKKRGHDVVLTTRDNPESLALIKHFDMFPAFEVGKFGDNRINKLLYGIKRIELLLPFFLDYNPDGIITLSEPNIIRLAFGLGMPIYNFIDIPEATAVCKLTLPLATWNFIPWIIPRHIMNEFGARQLYIYKCLDPIAWLSTNTGKLDDEFQFKDSYPLIVWRRGEVEASYYQDDEHQDITPLIIEKLIDKYPHYHYYELPRYKNHKIINLPALLKQADLFIGGGGTIQIESAYYGTWTITTRPFETYYDNFMVSECLMERVKTIEQGVDAAVKMLSAKSKNPNSEILRQMRFPVEEICDRIERNGIH